MAGNEQEEKARQVREVIGGIGELMQPLAAAMSQDPALRGLHKTEPLEPPVSGDFGEFSKKWLYTDGCELGTELVDGPVGVVVITADDKGEKVVVLIGHTPEKWSPKAGGHSIQTHDSAAGEPGEYLLQTVIGEGADAKQSFRYLDEADLRGVVVRNNEDQVQSGPNTSRNRQILINGRVVSVVGLLE